LKEYVFRLAFARRVCFTPLRTHGSVPPYERALGSNRETVAV
jgi:hypothetical protein